MDSVYIPVLDGFKRELEFLKVVGQGEEIPALD